MGQAGQASLKPIGEVAAHLGLAAGDIVPYGDTMAKIRLDRLPATGRRGRYILVTAINPTPLGEGKTTTSVGLGMALERIGVRSIVAIRQPSLGPLFGVKGGGGGGGKAIVVPEDDLNLHLTGDAHAVTAANNLLAAFLDNHLHHGNALGIDPERITWRRVVDMNDRALRGVEVGVADKCGPERSSGFDITAASEVMSILSVSADWADLRARLGRIVVGWTTAGLPVTADALGAGGPMAALLRDALQPNLMQTLEGTPAFVHTGPFGNVALGNSSVIADRVALSLADAVVTEAGFGSDLGAEKFFDVKCRVSGLWPDVAVVVTTIRALKAHSGRFRIVAGKPLDPGLVAEDLDALEAGLPNLVKHIGNVRQFGVPAVVAINRFPTDSPAEVARTIEVARAAGAEAVVSDVFANGGAGGEALARAVMAAGGTGAPTFLYDLSDPAPTKIEKIARAMYGADGVDFLPEAQAALDRFDAAGFGQLPICMAKTPVSLSDDPKLKGRPAGFRITIREVRLAAGAGYLVPLAGEVMLMPGLPANPAGAQIDLLPDGTIVGLH